MTELLIGGGPWRLFFFRLIAGAVLVYLSLPLLVVIPLSFNNDPYFVFPITSFSLRWYGSVVASPEWRLAAENSLIVAVATTALATALGTLAALGLANIGRRARLPLTMLMASPLAIPAIITAVSLYFFYSKAGLTGSLLGLVLAHTTIAVPFVLVTVSAALTRFDRTLARAAASLGADPLRVFRSITLPQIRGGILSGALFAFIVSFDDVVISLFIANAPQWTLPRQMWSGLKENIDPSILAAAVVLTTVTIALQLAMLLLGKKEGE
jgi:putative spermidine/putrescine transport system permease protein